MNRQAFVYTAGAWEDPRQPDLEQRKIEKLKLLLDLRNPAILLVEDSSCNLLASTNVVEAEHSEERHDKDKPAIHRHFPTGEEPSVTMWCVLGRSKPLATGETYTISKSTIPIYATRTDFELTDIEEALAEKIVEPPRIRKTVVFDLTYKDKKGPWYPDDDLVALEPTEDRWKLGVTSEDAAGHPLVDLLVKKDSNAFFVVWDTLKE